MKLRSKQVRRGLSLYLDTYNGEGERNYEFLGLYLTGDKERDRETMRLAEAIRARREVEHHAGRTGAAIAHRGRMPFLSAFKSYAETKTDNAYQSIQFHLEKWSRVNTRLRDITPEWLNELQRHLTTSEVRYGGKSLKKNSAATYYRAVLTFLNYAVRQRWITENPGDRAEKLSFPSAQRTFLSIEEVRALVATPCRYPDIKRAFLFSCATGMRLSDIEQLTWPDVAEGGLSKRQQKTGESVYLPLSQQARDILSAPNEQQPWRKAAARNKSRVFYLPSRYTIQRNVAAWAEAAGILRRVTFHVSRHTFATIALSHGAELLAISKYLGHTSVDTTLIYAHIVDSAKKRAAESIPQFM